MRGIQYAVTLVGNRDGCAYWILRFGGGEQRWLVPFPLHTAAQPSDNNLCPPRHCKFRGASYDGYHSKEAALTSAKIEEHPPWPQLPIPSSSFPPPARRLAGLWAIFRPSARISSVPM